MGKTYTRNPDSENYRGNVRRTRKQRKLERKERHRKDDVLENNMEADENFGNHTDNFRPRRDDW